MDYRFNEKLKQKITSDKIKNKIYIIQKKLVNKSFYNFILMTMNPFYNLVKFA